VVQLYHSLGISYSYAASVTSLAFDQRVKGRIKVVFLRPVKCTSLEKKYFFLLEFWYFSVAM